MIKPPKKTYLINRDFQLRYTRIAVSVGVVSTLVTLVLVLYPLVQFQIIRFPNFVPPPFLWAIAVAAVLNVLIVACLGILITHRIAGPMFALVRHMHLVRAGSYAPPLRVRDRDDLKYLVRNYNELIEHLRAVAARDKARLDGVIASLRNGQAGAALTGAEELQADYALRLEAPAPRLA
jgi:signal peptidase II